MNTDNGKIYEGDQAITSAVMRGEHLTPVEQSVAIQLRRQRAEILALKLEKRKRILAERQATRSAKSRRKKAIEKASRKRNRGKR